MEAMVLDRDMKAAAVVPLLDEDQYVKPGMVMRPTTQVQSWRLFTASKPTKLLTKIHGKWYDLTAFEKHHPGGPVALSLARGRDATVLFESHHPFTSRVVLNAILAKYEIDASDSKHLQTLEQQHGIMEYEFKWPSAFGEALKFQVKEYFQKEAARRSLSIRDAMKATPEHWAEIAILALIYFATFPGFFRGDWRFLVLFPIMTWAVFANTYHDATHFSLCSDWRLNAIIPYIYPFFSSPFAWYIQHNIGHHSYPNLGDRDPDVHHHSWMSRDHRDVKWLPQHRLQGSWWYIIARWAFAVEIGLATTNDLWMMQSKTYNDVVPTVAISGLRLIVHIIGRLVTIFIVHGWPFFCLSEATTSKCIVFGLVPYMVFSFLFMMSTQINHLLPHTTHIEDADWYKHQVITAQDFAVGSKGCHLFTGGLTYQVVHHLFPTVNNCHLPQLQPIVARLCEEYDVPYFTASGFVEALALHQEHAKRLSTQNKVA